MNSTVWWWWCFHILSGEIKDKNVQVVELPIVDSLHPRPPYLPLAVPEDLADRLVRVHGDPAVWWVSQFVKYLIRPQPWLEKEIEEATKKLGFKHPVIGWESDLFLIKWYGVAGIYIYIPLPYIVNFTIYSLIFIAPLKNRF